VVLFVCRLNRCGEEVHLVFLIGSGERWFLVVAELKLRVARIILNKMKNIGEVDKNLEVIIDLREVEN